MFKTMIMKVHDDDDDDDDADDDEDEDDDDLQVRKSREGPEQPG